MSTRRGWPIDPEVLAFVEETARHYPDSTNQASVEEARAAYDALCEAFAFPYPEGIVAQDSAISAASPAREISIRTYRDETESPDLQTEDEELQRLFGNEGASSTTCLVYLHGGGWVVGGLHSHDSICAELCATSTMDVIAVDYRLCPEHKYPAALDDAEAVYRQICGKYDHIVVGGDSAGGHLTAALCMRLRNSPDIKQPAAQLLIYPALGAVPEGGSYEQNADAPGLSTDDIVKHWEVLADGRNWRTTSDAELAPLRCEDFSGLPPAIITSAGCDPLRDDAMQYATLLTNAGVPVQWRNDPQLVHGHLRGRYMISTAMSHFNWVVQALGELVVSAEMERILTDPSMVDFLDD